MNETRFLPTMTVKRFESGLVTIKTADKEIYDTVSGPDTGVIVLHNRTNKAFMMARAYWSANGAWRLEKSERIGGRQYFTYGVTDDFGNIVLMHPWTLEK